MIVSARLAIPEGSVYTEELSNFLGTQMALMQSLVVINRAHARVLSQNTNMVMQKVTLKVATSPKTTIFVLQATGDEPRYTQAFLQACMDEYINFKHDMRTQTSDSTLAGLMEEVLRLKRDLQKSDDDLISFQTSNSVVLLQEQGNSAGNYLTALNQRLAGFKSEYDLLQELTLEQNLERKQIAGSLLPSVDELLSSTSSGKSEDTAQTDYFRAKQQIALLKAEQERLSEFLRPNHPRMVSLTEDISRRERLLDVFRLQSGEQLENWKSSLALQIQNLEKDVKEWEIKSLDISRKTAEYKRLESESARIQALYDRLLQTMQTLDVNKEINPESVTIMEKATPALPDRGELWLAMLLGALGGLVVGSLVLLLIDRLDDRMNSYTELQDLFDEAVLAQIPREKDLGKNGSALITADDSRHAFLEAFRNLRSSLLYMGETGAKPRTLLVTSSIPNEGKSITAANLAIILANSGSRVLLVDGDLRKGTLHEQFGMAAEAGLTEVLSGGKDYKEAVLPTQVSNLWLLSRGAITYHSSELFVGPLTAAFLKTATADYDYLVMDTAPVMAADDVTSLAPHMDATLFVIRAEHTSARVAHAALELLYQRRVNVMGLVFNSVRPSTADYYYYKYSDYYAKSTDTKTKAES
jgi:capsular exopolysaccharide synthesis family protein